MLRAFGRSRALLPSMKIAITGARGTVGTEVVKLAAKQGHHTIHISRTDQEQDDPPNTEMGTADAASSYEAIRDAFKGADAIIPSQQSRIQSARRTL